MAERIVRNEMYNVVKGYTEYNPKSRQNMLLADFCQELLNAPNIRWGCIYAFTENRIDFNSKRVDNVIELSIMGKKISGGEYINTAEYKGIRRKLSIWQASVSSQLLARINYLEPNMTPEESLAVIKTRLDKNTQNPWLLWEGNLS